MEHIILTPCGDIKGISQEGSGVIAFKGIRYATAGRWEYPEQVTHWDGIYDASQYGNCSFQPRSFYNEEENLKKIFYYNEFRKGESYTYDEDCLFLNIFTPETAKKGDNLPVLIYIHGGGFTGGCGHEKHFDGPSWPKKGVIGVTINYRLGPMGFVCLPELKEEAGCTGNYGLYDQLTAIKWVKDNIQAFGGDSENITIMGQSAGAMSVQQLCLSPLSDGLFQRAVMSSGGGVHKMFSAAAPEKSYDFWHACMKNADCETLADFRALEPEKLFSVWQSTRKEVKGGGCFPCMDGRFVVGTGTDILAAGKHKKISYMCGATSEDMAPPIILSMAEKWCAAQEKPSYVWLFDRKLPGDNNGAWHSSDLWYWFGTLKNCWRPMEEKDYALSDSMGEYLCNFVKCGDPNSDGLAKWQPCSEAKGKVMRLGEGELRMQKPNRFKLFITMLTNKAVGE